MKSVLIGACVALAAGLFGATGASADWRESVLRNKVYDSVEQAPKAATRTRKARSARRAASYDAPSGLGAPRQRRTRTRSAEYSGGGGGASSGLASYYWQPQRVASGGWFNPNAMTAAHKTLPFGTRVRVTNVRNGRSVVVTINDRGPYIAGRVIDLSKAAAGVIGMQQAGVVPVRIDRL